MLKLRLQGQFFTRNCNNIFQKLLRYHHAEKIATWLRDVLAKLADRNIARIFRVFNFTEVVALPVQGTLHTEILMCDGNTIIS